MKQILNVLGGAVLTLSPVVSLLAFVIYGGNSQFFDAVCFVTFGATCYCLAHLQSYIKNS